MIISQRLKNLRESNNLTVKQLSQLSNVSQSYIREIESGIKENLSVQKLELLCAALNMSLVEFFSETGLENQQDQEKLPYYQRALIKRCYQLEKDEAEILLKLLEMLEKNRVDSK